MKRPTRTPKSEQPTDSPMSRKRPAQSEQSERPPLCDIGVDLLRDVRLRDPDSALAKRFPPPTRSSESG